MGRKYFWMIGTLALSCAGCNPTIYITVPDSKVEDTPTSSPSEEPRVTKEVAKTQPMKAPETPAPSPRIQIVDREGNYPSGVPFTFTVNKANELSTQFTNQTDELGQIPFSIAPGSTLEPTFDSRYRTIGSNAYSYLAGAQVFTLGDDPTQILALTVSRILYSEGDTQNKLSIHNTSWRINNESPNFFYYAQPFQVDHDQDVCEVGLGIHIDFDRWGTLLDIREDHNGVPDEGSTGDGPTESLPDHPYGITSDGQKGVSVNLCSQENQFRLPRHLIANTRYWIVAQPVLGGYGNYNVKAFLMNGSPRFGSVLTSVDNLTWTARSDLHFTGWVTK